MHDYNFGPFKIPQYAIVTVIEEHGGHGGEAKSGDC